MSPAFEHGALGVVMKADIHPNYMTCKVSCVCGGSFETLSGSETLKLDICNLCHPFYTGTQKLMDTEGRVERFRKKYGIQDAS
jgi:large subunit ribosomal protein L31